MAVLEDLGADVHQRQGPLSGDLAEPRQLLITSWARAQDLGERCLGSDRSTWVCVHSEDVAPLRDRMRELGVQYLVHRRLEGEALRLLLLQLLYQGPERRAEPRAPVGCDLIWSVACERRRGVLAELSVEGARMLSDRPVLPETGVILFLPAELGLGGGCELQGRSIRCSPCPIDGEEEGYSVVVAFDALSAQKRKRLMRFAAGAEAGSRFAPLEGAGEIGGDDAGEDDVEIALDRRASPRRSYDRSVLTLASKQQESPDVILGYDLSISGMRVARHLGLDLGDRIAVALHGASSGHPLVLDACVVRDHGADGLGLAFHEPSADKLLRLEALLEELPALEALGSDVPTGAGLVVTRRVR